MKHFLCIMLCLGLCGCVCGCNRTAEYREPEQVIITSALGFDNSDGLLLVSVETVNIYEGGEGNEGGYKPVVLSGEGVTTEQAIQEISDTLSGKLFLGHCGIIVIGSSITGNQLDGIMNFCKQEHEMSLAVKVVAAENAGQLLKCKGYSNESIGYDFLRLLNTKGDIAAPDYYAGLFSIEGLRAQETNLFTVLNFSIAEKDGVMSYYPDGICVYKNDELIRRMSESQDTVCKILSNGYYGNTLTLNGDAGMVQAQIRKTHCKIMPGFESGNLVLDFNIDITAEPEGLIENSIGDFERALYGEICSVINFLQQDLKEDVLHITESIRKKHPIIYRNIAESPREAFLDAVITVNCNMHRGGGK